MPKLTRLFFRAILSLPLAGIVAGTMPSAALAWPAVEMRVGVRNASDACIWVTPYAASFVTPWRIISHGGDNRPHFVSPGHTAYWATPIEQPLSPLGAKTPVEIKVLAERVAHATCSGANVARYEKENKGLFADKGFGTHGSVYTVFQGERGNYWLADLKQPIPDSFKTHRTRTGRGAH